MRALFYITALLIYSANSHAQATYDASKVAKRKALTELIDTKELPSQPKTDEKTPVTFEFTVLEDSTLWIQPLLDEQDAKIQVGPTKIDRGLPVQIPIGGYKAHEFFKLNDELYVTLSDSVSPNSRYLMRLSGVLAKKISLGGAIRAANPSLGSYIIAAFIGLSAKEYPHVCLAAAALFALAQAHTCYNSVREYLASAKPEFQPFKTVNANGTDERLEVIKIYFNPTTHEVDDVLLKNWSGQRYSLRKVSGYSTCGPGLAGLVY